ncbi:hypothetical protein [Pseudomonas guariconensis]|uniref:hypothetical protein n=1 Tax=Pseudomonas guariconensis TaxID=1288410 RepID=UPI0018D77CE8|nr:hypothetical protein [Pseudomonas guariconensis]MBH3356701.1 hypothetical protein [Pseudomonas guariconensis]
MTKSIVSILVLAALAGCAANPVGLGAATVSSLMTAPALFKGQIDPFSASGPNRLKVGDSYTQLAVFSLRSCSHGMADCKVGKGRLQSKATVVGLSKSEATVRIDLQFDVDHEQTVQDEVSTTTYKLQDVPTLNGKSVTSETISLAYNSSRRIELPYGVAFNVCVDGVADSVGAEPNNCQGLPLR